MQAPPPPPPPPLPPRPVEQYYMPRYSPYGGPSHFFGMTGTQPPIDEAFQSVHSIVQAVSSISMMLESTYMAVNSSFRAVMDVADHFIRLKDSLTGVISVVNILSTIKWFFKRILYMFNMVSEDQIWSDSLTKASAAVERGHLSILDQKQQSSWPILMFLGVAIGAPYMIYQIKKPSPSSSKWLTQEDCHYIGEALYDFSTNQQSEIPLKAGERVIIAPKEQQPRVTDWLLATTDGKKAGLIPMNYVKIVKFEIVE